MIWGLKPRIFPLAPSRVQSQPGLIENPEILTQHPRYRWCVTHGAQHSVCRYLCQLPLVWASQVAHPPDLCKVNHTVNTGHHGTLLPSGQENWNHSPGLTRQQSFNELIGTEFLHSELPARNLSFILVPQRPWKTHILIKIPHICK